MNNSRRELLKLAGIAAGVCAVAPVANAIAAGGGGGKKTGHLKKRPEQLKAGRWAMVVDTRKLNSRADFVPLIEACHSVHNVPNLTGPEEIKWLWFDSFKHVFPTMSTRYPKDRMPKKLDKPFLLLCNHCEHPPCVRVCPTQATFQREDGIVAMDFHRCIGCRYCMAGCPYGARSFNFSDPRKHLDMSKVNYNFPTRQMGVVEKCNFCAGRLAEGKMPACVEASKGALIFGDLDDAGSPVSRALRDNFTVRRSPKYGTGPNVYYII